MCKTTPIQSFMWSEWCICFSGCKYLLITFTSKFLKIRTLIRQEMYFYVLFYAKEEAEIIYLCKRSLEYFTFVVVIRTT